MVESWFGVLTCPLLHRGDFASGDDVEAWITTFAIRHNKKARPYKWSYDAGAEHTRYLERRSQPEAGASRKAHNYGGNRDRPGLRCVR
jgi:hypothetical protein